MGVKGSTANVEKFFKFHEILELLFKEFIRYNLPRKDRVLFKTLSRHDNDKLYRCLVIGIISKDIKKATFFGPQIKWMILNCWEGVYEYFYERYSITRSEPTECLLEEDDPMGDDIENNIF